MSAELHEPFPHTWSARILSAPPLIAPARQFVYPQHVPGEEDALARGALLLDVKPATEPNFLATCALGFRDPSLPSGVWSCPRLDDLLAVAGGYAYLIDTAAPAQCLFLPLRPVTAILAAPEQALLLLAGFHYVCALGPEGLCWTTGRLSWEGITLTGASNGQLHGCGWNLPDDREIPFVVDLATGVHQGGGYGI